MSEENKTNKKKTHKKHGHASAEKKHNNFENE